MLRDPGASTTSRSPHRISSSLNVTPNAVDGFTAAPPPGRYLAAAAARSRQGAGSVSQRASSPGSTAGRRTGSSPASGLSGPAVTSPASSDMVPRPQA